MVMHPFIRILLPDAGRVGEDVAHITSPILVMMTSCFLTASARSSLPLQQPWWMLVSACVGGEAMSYGIDIDG